MAPIDGDEQFKRYVCINCGHKLATLYKRYDNSVKPVNCSACGAVADKYIEFEPIIVLIDALLLSEASFRHVLFNRDFKLHWKLSLVLLLLESFALWRCHSKEKSQLDLHEKGFYICCLQNIFDYTLHVMLLWLLSMWLQRQDQYKLPPFDNWPAFVLLLLKGLALASFSKFFLLPIMIWRQNTTDTGAQVHHMLVLCHHVCSLLCVFTVIVSGLNKPKAALLIMPIFLLKEQLKQVIFDYLESFF